MFFLWIDSWSSLLVHWNTFSMLLAITEYIMVGYDKYWYRNRTREHFSLDSDLTLQNNQFIALDVN